jgi:CDP-glucose 4,6-dehydratase
MENMGLSNNDFWKDKRVLITGHTGFKGAWLSLWLIKLGAKVSGYALNPPTVPSLYNICELDTIMDSNIADIRDATLLRNVLIDFKPEIVFHMAAQPLVRESYLNPVETYAINVMGTVNLLEAIRNSTGVKAVVNITTDKCYENKEWPWGYRENEPLGGYDPYSNSKACSELVTEAYRNSYFNPNDYHLHGVAIATARAGNVVGGGDWAKDRLIPDIIRAVTDQTMVEIRNPDAIRPWQHVLEPLHGYQILAEKLYKDGPQFSGAWNFGPNDDDAKPVSWLIEKFCSKWGPTAQYSIDLSNHPHEAHYLKLDCSKARSQLNWHSRWDLDETINKIIGWTRGYQDGMNPTQLCLNQIEEYERRGR